MFGERIRCGVLVVFWVALALGLAACESDSKGPAPEPDTVGGVDVIEDDIAAPGDDVAEDALPSPDSDTTPPPPGTVRFIHISDLHIRSGPPAPLPQNAVRAMEQLNALEFDADVVLLTGDLTEWVPEGLSPEEPSMLTMALEALASLRWPVWVTAGNHDYYGDPYLGPTTDREARRAYLEAVIGYPMDESRVFDGVRLVMMDSMWGDQGEPTRGLVGSFTDDQLDWLRGELADGAPALLFFHHPPADVVTATGDSLCAVIEENPGVVKAMFAGHLHNFWIGEYCGVPHYLVSDVVAGTVFYYLVEYDGATDTLTIVNEDEIAFATPPEFDCDETQPGLPDPEVLAGTNQVIWMGNMMTNLPGLEGFDGESMNDTPFVLRIDTWDEARGRLGGRLSLTEYTGGAVHNMPGAPCVPLSFRVGGPCLESDDTPFTLDLAPLLTSLFDLALESPWNMRLDVQSFTIDARAEVIDGETPRLDSGLVYLVGSATRGIGDLRRLLVAEYCAGRIPNCQPGSADRYPECGDPPGEGMFERIPLSCDVDLDVISLRFLLTFLNAYPLDHIVLEGDFEASAWPTSASVEPSTVDEAVFATGDGANCAP